MKRVFPNGQFRNFALEREDYCMNLSGDGNRPSHHPTKAIFLQLFATEW